MSEGAKVLKWTALLLAGLLGVAWLAYEVLIGRREG